MFTFAMTKAMVWKIPDVPAGKTIFDYSVNILNVM